MKKKKMTSPKNKGKNDNRLHIIDNVLEKKQNFIFKLLKEKSTQNSLLRKNTFKCLRLNRLSQDRKL